MAAKLGYTVVQDWHLRHIAFNMRKADVEEVRATNGKTPMEALTEGCDHSVMLATVLAPDGLPIALIGLRPKCRLTGTASPWMLGTDEVLKFKKNFLTDPPFVLGEMMEAYPRLENFVHIRNEASVRWLRAMGFNMDEPVVFPSGEKFMRFHMTREN